MDNPYSNMSALELGESIKAHSLAISILNSRFPQQQLVALKKVQDNPDLLDSPSVRDALKEVSEDSNPTVREMAREILEGVSPQ